MPAQITWYEVDGTTPLAPFDFGEVLAGETSPTWTVVAKNTGDEACTPEFWVSAIKPTGGFDHADPAFAGGWWKIALTAAAGGASTQTTAATPVGDGLVLAAEAIPAGGSRTMEVTLEVPLDAASSATGAIVMSARYGAGAIAGWRYSHAAGLGGVVFRRDLGATYLAESTGLELTGLDLSFDYVCWRDAGIPRSAVGYSSTLTASASGMERFVTISVDAAGTVTETDGAEVASVTESDKADAPAGDLIVGYAMVDDTEIAYVEDAPLGGELRVRSGGALTVSVDSGRAMVGERAVLVAGGTATLEDDEVSVVGVTVTGSPVAWLETASPTFESEPLAVVTTAAGAITEILDVRRRASRVVELGGSRTGTLAVNDVIAFGVWCDGIGYPRMECPYAVGVLDNGAASGGTEIDFQIWDGSWTSVFAAAPTIAHDATVNHIIGVRGTGAPVERLAPLKPGMLWRWIVTAVPGTASSNAFAVLYVEV